MTDARSLWATHEVARGHQLRLALGPLDLRVQRLEHEWRLALSHDDDPMRDAAAWRVEPADALDEGDVHARMATGGTDTALRLIPAAADRPMVVRPAAPLSLLAGETASFFTSTPLWVQLDVGGRRLTEHPTLVPRQTWFGESTRSGQLCYAARTTARLRPDLLLHRLGRLYTEVRVANRGGDPLHIERVQLPLPHLPLGLAADGRLWTPPVTVIRTGDEPDAEVRTEAPPSGWSAFAPARLKGTPSIVVRALGALLS